MTDTKQHILQVARAIFTQKGFAATRTAEIAEKAGVNKALLHYHFRTKKDLFRAIVEETVGILIPRLVKAMESEGSISEKIDLLVDRYIETILEYPHIPIFMLTELSQNREDFVELVKSKAHLFPDFQRFFAQIMQESQSGSIRMQHPVHLMMNIISLCIFPFLMRPMVTNVIGVPENQYDQLMQERAREVKSFIHAALNV